MENMDNDSTKEKFDAKKSCAEFLKVAIEAIVVFLATIIVWYGLLCLVTMPWRTGARGQIIDCY